MAIYIKGVDLPEAEWLDIRVRADGPSEVATKEHPYWKEIEVMEVAEPTGGLICRADLFNQLAEIKSPPEANEYKAEVYALIQSMEVKA